MDKPQIPMYKITSLVTELVNLYSNDKIAASLLKRVGHEKMAELSSLQIKIVMGARSGGLDSRMALRGEADEIITKAIEVLGREVVAELREKVQEALSDRSQTPSSSFNQYPKGR